ncbi:MAG: carboxypeptidase regulatory-like domain-containing protein, partial [Acidobacteria bacterium]|nr:carboxypeptidase regulatory-like domain-containing protein [Acidobacteriota bacterium]
SLRQTRRALARPPYETSNAPAANGVIFYALGNTLPGVTTNNSTNAAVTNNPFSYPTTGISTPKRPNADFFAALRTGASASGTTRFESEMLAPLFPTVVPAVVPVPDMLWKSQPTEGYIMGFAKRADERPLDSATVTITNLNTGSTRTTVTDGGGFYGGVKLTPGQYLVKAILNFETVYSCIANVSAGTVTTANLQPDITAPEITLTANPNRIFPPNGQSVTVTLSGGGSDTCSGLASVSYVVIDEYGTTLNIPARTLSGNSDSWTDSLIVEASRRGDDSDGRLYRVTATIMDAAGNTSTATADIVIQHDRGNR